jgi:uncharacterized protein (DUF1800 family)
MPSFWSPYLPSDSAPWNLARCWTLHRRAGFGATWAELERDLAEGPEAAIDRVVGGASRSTGTPGDFAQIASVLGDAAAGSGNAERLKAWWLYRIVFSPDPLTERLTLVWHNHFATSQLKVADLAAMRRQNETFRKHARGRFGDLLRAMLSDPALLVFLDAPANRKDRPNENFARELLELFTLGAGNFTEQDVKEAARALTGRSVVTGVYQFDPEQHDDAEKTTLGQTGRFNGEAMADLLLDHPATARRLAWRLCEAFLGEELVDEAGEAAVAQLAAQLQNTKLDIGRAVETILRSQLFFSEQNLHARVCDPVTFIVSAVRAIEQFSPPPSTLLLAEWCDRLGHELFFPSNVGGWRGGRSWLTARSIIARANFAAALVEGRLVAGAKAAELAALVERNGSGRSTEESMAFFDNLLTGGHLGPAERSEILSAAAAKENSTEQTLARAVALLLARPEAQLT